MRKDQDLAAVRPAWQQMDGQEDRWSAAGPDGPQLLSRLPSWDLKEDTGSSWVFPGADVMDNQDKPAGKPASPAPALGTALFSKQKR